MWSVDSRMHISTLYRLWIPSILKIYYFIKEGILKAEFLLLLFCFLDVGPSFPPESCEINSWESSCFEIHSC